MAVKGFTMTKNDGTELGSFHAACFLENRLFGHTNSINNSGMLKSLLPQNTLRLDFND